MTDVEKARLIVANPNGYTEDSVAVARALLAIAEPKDMRERACNIVINIPRKRLFGNEEEAIITEIATALATAHAEGRAAQRREDAEIARRFASMYIGGVTIDTHTFERTEAEVRAKDAANEIMRVSFLECAAAIEGGKP